MTTDLIGLRTQEWRSKIFSTLHAYTEIPLAYNFSLLCKAHLLHIFKLDEICKDLL